MAKGRKRTSVLNDAISALNSIGREHKKGSGNAGPKLSKEEKLFAQVAPMMQNLAMARHKGGDGKMHEIQARNKAGIVNPVVVMLAKGVSAEAILAHARSTVRAERFGLQDPAVRQLVCFGVMPSSEKGSEPATPLTVSRSELCKVFGWDAPTETEMREFLSHFPAPEENTEQAENASNESAASGESQTEEKSDAETTGRMRRRNRRADKAPVAAE